MGSFPYLLRFNVRPRSGDETALDFSDREHSVDQPPRLGNDFD